MRSVLRYGLVLLAMVALRPVSFVQARPQLVDQIVAIVDDEIVLRSEVMAQIQLMAMGAGMSRSELTPEWVNESFQQILENMIQERLLLARAEEDSIEVDRDMVEEAVRARMRELKAQHGEADFAKKLEDSGVAERDVREQIRQDIKKDYLRRQMYSQLAGSVEVSYGDVEAFREASRDKMPELFSISHILIRAEPSTDQDARVKELADAVLARIRQGEDFSELARKVSDDAGSAEEGGDLGYFSRGSMVPEFEEVAFSLQPGEVSEPVRTAFGYHVIRVEGVDGDQVHARHILLSLRAGEGEEAAARDLAASLRERAMAGEAFDALAREHSQDETTAKLGGKLPGLYTLENLPPEFGGEIKWMKLGDVSAPVETEYGWHVVKLNDDRDAIEEVLRQVRIQDEFDEIIQETREKLYVEIRPVDFGR